MTNPLSRLSPPIPQRLQAWEDIQQRLREEREVKIRPTVTLSRVFGCEGFPVAERLKELLELQTDESWVVYDKALLEAALTTEGTSEKALKNLGIMASSFERLGLATAEFYEHVRAFDALSRHIVHIAHGGNAIIVGRGGSVLCNALTNCFHFRIEASLEWRINAVMRRLGMPRHEAETFVAYNSKNRVDFIRNQLKIDPQDLSYYDATFNNARHGVLEMAAAMAAYIQESWASSPHAHTLHAP